MPIFAVSSPHVAIFLPENYLYSPRGARRNSELQIISGKEIVKIDVCGRKGADLRGFMVQRGEPVQSVMRLLWRMRCSPADGTLIDTNADASDHTFRVGG